MKTCETCAECKGQGQIENEVCISEWTPPCPHEREDDMNRIVADAAKSKSDHKRLCEINPRAKESYDRQLSETLAKLESAAKALL